MLVSVPGCEDAHPHGEGGRAGLGNPVEEEEALLRAEGVVQGGGRGGGRGAQVQELNVGNMRMYKFVNIFFFRFS